MQKYTYVYKTSQSQIYKKKKLKKDKGIFFYIFKIQLNKFREKMYFLKHNCFNFNSIMILTSRFKMHPLNRDYIYHRHQLNMAITNPGYFLLKINYRK